MNQLLPFLIPGRGARGYWVELTEGLDAMFGWREYPPDVAQQLGEALAAAPLLAADMTQPGRFNLQFQGEGPVKMLVTQIDEQLRLRGMAKHAPDASGDFQALMKGGLLAAMIEPSGEGERYQAMVEVLGLALSEALQIYFSRSEQLQTLIRLSATDGKLAGLLVQRLPEGAGTDDDNWEHVYTLMRTVTPDDLQQWSGTELLHRVFAEDEVRVFTPRPVELVCRCSDAQISAMLLGLGRDEVDSVIAEQGEVAIHCEFCGRGYRYAQDDVARLFAAESVETPRITRH
jgi:molecular chaperone Hsp33